MGRGEGIRKGTIDVTSMTSVFHLAPSAGYLVRDDFEMSLGCAIKYEVKIIVFMLII